LTLTTTFSWILGRGTHSSLTSITIVSNMAFGFTSNISSEEDYNSRA